MHLCLITSSYPTRPDDLALPFLPQFAAALEGRGHRVTVVAPDRRAERSVSSDRVLWFGWLGGRRPVVSLAGGRPADLAIASHLLAAAYATVAALHARDPIDHVLALFAIPAGLVAGALRASHGIPYSIWALGSDVLVLARRQPFRGAIGAALRGADHCFADGLAMAEEVAALAGRPCGFLPSVRALPPSAPVELDRGRRNLLYLGRLEPVKGVDVLLQAFGRVAADQPDLDLHLVGDGSLAAAARAAADGHTPGAPRGRVFLHAPVGPAGVAGYLAAANLLVLPSRSESIPTTLLEAAAAGLPALASAVGDVPRLAVEYGLATLVPPGDPEALAAGLAAWAAEPPTRLPSATAARARAEFQPDAAAARFLSMLGAGAP